MRLEHRHLQIHPVKILGRWVQRFRRNAYVLLAYHQVAARPDQSPSESFAADPDTVGLITKGAMLGSAGPLGLFPTSVLYL
jgi:hypothetical protein